MATVPVDMATSDSLKFECGICLKEFSTSWCLQIHIKTHDENQSFDCHECGKTFSSFDLLSEHLKEHIFGTESVENVECCTVCGKQYLSSQMSMHKRTHIFKPGLTCHKCGKSFGSSKVLKLHLRTHEKVIPFQCSACGLKFATRNAFMLHWNSKCSLNKTGTHSAGECSKGCPIAVSPYLRTLSPQKHTSPSEGKMQKGNIKVNLKHVSSADITKSGKLFKCNICGKMFVSRLTAVKHYQVHQNKHFTCKQCGKSLDCLSSLRTHEWEHTAVSLRPQCSLTVIEKTVKASDLIFVDGMNFTCTVCKKSFSTKQKASVHTLCHRRKTGDNRKEEKSHPQQSGIVNERAAFHSNSHKHRKCSVQSKNYVITESADTLSRESVKHSCSECRKSFRSALDLKNHKSVHIREHALALMRILSPNKVISGSFLNTKTLAEAMQSATEVPMDEGNEKSPSTSGDVDGLSYPVKMSLIPLFEEKRVGISDPSVSTVTLVPITSCPEDEPVPIPVVEPVLPPDSSNTVTNVYQDLDDDDDDDDASAFNDDIDFDIIDSPVDLCTQSNAFASDKSDNSDHLNSSFICKEEICFDQDQELMTAATVKANFDWTRSSNVGDRDNNKTSKIPLVSVYDINNKIRLQNEKYQCEICTKEFLSKRKVYNHVRNHLAPKIYKCSVCGYAFTNKTNMEKHEKRVHNLKHHTKIKTVQKGGTYVNVSTGAVSELHEEKTGHGSGQKYVGVTNKYARPQSKKNFQNFRKTRLDVYEKILKKNGSYQCELCSKDFTTEKKAILHVRNHLQAKVFKCDECGHALSRRNALEIHKNRHKRSRELGCPTFTRKYRTVKMFNIDVKDDCVSRTEDPNSLGQISEVVPPQEHASVSEVSQAGEILQRPQDFPENRVKEPLNYMSPLLNFRSKRMDIHMNIVKKGDRSQCKLCNKEFSTFLKTYSHVRCHLQEKKLKCDECGLAIRSMNHYRLHKQGHELRRLKGIPQKKPVKSWSCKFHIVQENRILDNGLFMCKICEKKFPGLIGLDSHIRRHFKKYKCLQCDKIFDKKSALEEHEILHKLKAEEDTERLLKLFPGVQRNVVVRLERLEESQFSNNPGIWTFIHKPETASLQDISLDESQTEHERDNSLKNVDQHTPSPNPEWRSHISSEINLVQIPDDMSGDFHCQICNKGFKESNFFNTEEHVDNHFCLFDCPFCCFSFPTKRCLWLHISRSDHIDVKSGLDKNESIKKRLGEKTLFLYNNVEVTGKRFFCKICHHTCGSKQGAKDHVASHYKGTPDPAEDASLNSANYSKQGEELSLSSGGPKHDQTNFSAKPVNAEVHEDIQKSDSKLDRFFHFVSRSGDDYHCNVCQTAFTSREKVKNHARGHLYRNTFKCKVCSQAFQYKRNLLLHKRLHGQIGSEQHSYDTESVEGQKLGSDTAKNGNDSQLDTSKSLSSMCMDDYIEEKTNHFLCTICARKFESYEEIKLHMNTHGTGVEGKSSDATSEIGTFSNEDGRKTHVRVEEEILSDQTEIPVGEIKTEDRTELRHDCKEITDNRTCDTFKIAPSTDSNKSGNNFIIQSHVRPNGKKFICTICNKIFYDHAIVNDHVRFHFKKKFKCRFCKETFQTRSHLRSHKKSCHVHVEKCTMKPPEKKPGEDTDMKDIVNNPTGDVTDASSCASQDKSVIDDNGSDQTFVAANLFTPVTDVTRDNTKTSQITPVKDVATDNTKSSQISHVKDVTSNNTETSQINSVKDVTTDNTETSQITFVKDVTTKNTKTSQITSFKDVTSGNTETSQITSVKDVTTDNTETSQITPVKDVTSDNTETSQSTPVKDVTTDNTETSQITPVKDDKTDNSEASQITPFKAVTTNNTETSQITPVKNVTTDNTETSQITSVKDVSTDNTETSQITPIKDATSDNTETSQNTPVKDVASDNTETSEITPAKDVATDNTETSEITPAKDVASDNTETSQITSAKVVTTNNTKTSQNTPVKDVIPDNTETSQITPVRDVIPDNTETSQNTPVKDVIPDNTETSQITPVKDVIPDNTEASQNTPVKDVIPDNTETSQITPVKDVIPDNTETSQNTPVKDDTPDKTQTTHKKSYLSCEAESNENLQETITSSEKGNQRSDIPDAPISLVKSGKNRADNEHLHQGVQSQKPVEMAKGSDIALQTNQTVPPEDKCSDTSLKTSSEIFCDFSDSDDMRKEDSGKAVAPALATSGDGNVTEDQAPQQDGSVPSQSSQTVTDLSPDQKQDLQSAPVLEDEDDDCLIDTDDDNVSYDDDGDSDYKCESDSDSESDQSVVDSTDSNLVHDQDQEPHLNNCNTPFQSSLKQSVPVKHVRRYVKKGKLSSGRKMDYQKGSQQAKYTMDDDGKFHCTSCSQICDSIEGIQNHIQSRHVVKTFWCKLCQAAFHTNDELQQHYSSNQHLEPQMATRENLNDNVQKVGDRYKCKLCGKEFAGRLQCMNHVRYHLGVCKYKCDECGLACRKKAALKSHQLTHTKLRPFKCKLCSKDFPQKEGLRIHQKSHSVQERVKFLGYLTCKICGDVFSTQLVLDNHMKKKHITNHPCIFCGISFETQHALDNHQYEETHYKCSHCEKVFKTGSGLRIHQREHTDNEVYPCELCGKICKSRSTLNSHLQLHNNVAKYVCKICGQKSNKKFWLEKHIKSHEAGGGRCEPCKNFFKNTASLEAHRLMHKVVEAAGHIFNKKTLLKLDKTVEYTCPICQTVLNTYIQMRNHIAHHMKEKKHKCDICGLSFHSSYYLKSHIQLHNNDLPFQCDRCPKRCPTKALLNLHIRQIHLKVYHKEVQCKVCKKMISNGNKKAHMLSHEKRERKYPCDECDLKFFTASSLKSHKKTHNNPYDFVCELCAARYTNKYALREHMLRHTGKKEFKCDECEKEFVLKAYLQRHLKSHKNERSFKCDECGKGFNYRNSLNDHMRIHTGERKYTCKFCDRRFIDRGARRTHVKSHHKSKD